MTLRISFLFFLIFIPLNLLLSQSKSYTTIKLTGAPPEIDGYVEDQAWQQIGWEGNFTEFQPNNGEVASQKTEFKILYDEDNIYVAIKAYDTEINEIAKRMTRRDGFEGDLAGIMIDSYFDKRTSFNFIVNASGVKSDAIQTEDNGDDMDESWDPIWYTKTSYDQDGWNAEMKIPLSQLRFSQKNIQLWGLQVARFVFREEEFSLWQNIPKDASGWTSLFGELNGLKDLQPKKQVEIAPYLVGKVDTYEKEEGNPYRTGSNLGYNIGLDGKIGITNNMILDFTINPDFGQVEADPSEVNLTAFETFFDEKRPFFIEGKNITDYQITPGGHPWASDNLFYSRRIGRMPHGEPDVADNEYIDTPQNTKILGAFKLTGKTNNGWSYGLIESITNQEEAEITDGTITRKEIVEPFSNYLIGRLQRDINKGNTIIGGMFTLTNRKLEETGLDFLTKNAWSGGIDFKQYFASKKYYISLKMVYSQLNGSSESILEQQLSSRRYYQRPDVNYMKVDSGLTTLSGHGGTFLIGKQVTSGFRFLFNATWRSPGLELNDAGYLKQANTIFQFLSVGYSTAKSFSIFRRINAEANQFSGWDFGGVNVFDGANINAFTQFTNQWVFNLGTSFEFHNIENTLLRGGPSMKMPASWNYFTGLGSNSTKKLFGEFSFSQNSGDENYLKSTNYEIELTYRPIDRLSLSASPSYSLFNTELQYINEASYNNNARYIFGTLDQETFALTLRVDLNIKPDLTLQFYGSPFISAGNFNEIKRITNPKADDYHSRFYVFTESEISYSGIDEGYYIDENNDLNDDYFIENPNFNFKEFKSNLVLRWEYSPGSLIYVVWSQGKTGYENYGNFDYLKNMNELFSITGNNTFLIKISHRFRAK